MTVREIEGLKILSNESVVESKELLAEIAYVYMTVFGNAAPLFEGGVDIDGRSISITEYLGLLKPLVGGSELLDLGVKRTEDVISWLRWLSQLQVEERERLVVEVERLSGYRPFYDFEKLHERFVRDLEPSGEVKPMFAYYGDQEGEVVGFIMGMVCDTEESFWRLVKNTPYLQAFYTDIYANFGRLAQKMKFTLPILLESEGGILTERVGKRGGSRWDELMLAMRVHGWSDGAKLGIGFTFADSRYYINGKEKGEFVEEAKLSDGRGGEMIMTVVDLERSVKILAEKVERRKIIN